MRIALAQFDSTVGDLEGNALRMRRFYEKALTENVNLLVFPELSLCGYPPEDLVYKRHFLESTRKVLDKLAADCPRLTMIVGFPGFEKMDIFNSAAVLQNGSVTSVYKKSLLPNFSVFDEKRYFTAGTEPLVINLEGLDIAVTICRDIWDIEWLKGFFKDARPFQLLVNLSASPFYLDKTILRRKIVGDCAITCRVGVAYCNLVGAQDELVFDGRSMFADFDGNITGIAAAFEEDLFIADVIKEGDQIKFRPLGEKRSLPESEVEEIYHALVLGTRDYTRKNGFQKVMLGLSGGIDSAVVAAIAAEGLGTNNVTAITMPSRFNSTETVTDAGKIAANLGIEFLTIPIEPMLSAFNDSLNAVEGWNDKTIAYENLQARIRGTVLMSLSNQFGSLVLTSGNKSETAVGYATLYGDTAGGFAVIKDVFKTAVYQLARYINQRSGCEVIPSDVINRPPTAELKENQKDTDSLPAYDVLDKILKGYVEQDKSARLLIEQGYPTDIVKRVVNLVDRSEYKRRQSPPGIKITPRAFGKDRRMPITNRYKGLNDSD